MIEPPVPRFHDLQSFIVHLEQQDRLKRISAPIDKDTELACVARWALECSNPHDAYGILFERVTGFDIPVAVNLFYPRDTYADALGVEPTALLERWSEALAEPIPPAPVEGAEVHAEVERDSPSLESIPIPIWTPGKDRRPYLSAGCVITKDPDTGVQNMGTYRLQVHDARRLGLAFGTDQQHGAIHYKKYADREEPMPVAVVVGAAPSVCFAAAAKTAYGVDELGIAGGLAGAPVSVVAGSTVDLLVPATAEYVIEGFVAPGKAEHEGPFGEALGYMERGNDAPIIDVSAVCHRATPVHHGYIQQLPPSDGHLVLEMGILGPLWYYLTRSLRLGGVEDIAVVRGAAGVSMIAVQLDTSMSELSSVARAFTQIGFGQKFVVMVDTDVDIRDHDTVLWAITSRVDPLRDIQLLDGITVFQSDPSVLARAAAEGRSHGSPPFRTSIAVIDATIKCDIPARALPRMQFMSDVLARWSELGLPPIRPRRRLTTMLEADP